MRLGLGWLLLALTVTWAPAAQACVPAQGWPEGVKINEREAAALLVQSATFIDLAEVETLTPDPVQTARGGEWVDGDAVLIHLRVIQRLKGNPATPVRDLSGISHLGFVPPRRILRGEPAWGRRPFAALPYFINRRELSEVGITDCYWMDSIGGWPGLKVLVFRDAEGGLLNLRIPAKFGGRYRGVWGPSFTVVSGPDDPWVKLIDKEVTDHGPRFYDDGDLDAPPPSDPQPPTIDPGS